MNGVRELLKKGVRVGFFGLGKSNLALLRCLPLSRCVITLRSDEKIPREAVPTELPIARILERDLARRGIDDDILFFSPSVRREGEELRLAKERGCIFTSDAELFTEESTRPIFAVSGSDGKSTTASMTHLMLGGSVLAGNIGKPMVEALWARCNSYVVELSSFMLTYAKVRARRACITNVTQNHLDWHSSFEEYANAKLSLAKSADECVLNADDEISAEYARKNRVFAIISSRKEPKEIRQDFGAEVIMTLGRAGIERNGELFIPFESIKHKEEHNLKNLMMAAAMADGFSSHEQIREAAATFSSLAHRCEAFATIDGIEYIDSSIDSSPSRTAQTLSSLGRRVVLLMGGRSKGADMRVMGEAVKKYTERAIIFGENREEIFEAIKDCTRCEICSDMHAAVMLATEAARECKTVLLSPASTSYDAFHSFEERGKCFKDIVIKNAKTSENR